LGVAYSPQQISVVSSIYHNRWFSIQIRNDENALEITTRVKNTPRHSLQIFTDWLDESGLTAFINRFRIYSIPHGLGESLFDTGAGLQGALVQFPNLRARLELACNLLDVHELRYSLLSDLSATDTLDVILASMRQFCDAYEMITDYVDFNLNLADGKVYLTTRTSQKQGLTISRCLELFPTLCTHQI